MKLYIYPFNLDSLPNIYKKLATYQIHSENYMQVYSQDGVYLVDQNSINKLKPVDHDIFMMEDYYEDLSILIDPSFYILEKSSQIHNEHICKMMQRDIYGKEKNNNIKLVIESEIISNQINKNQQVFKDIYIECPNNTNINDALVKKEIIVLLVLLN